MEIILYLSAALAAIAFLILVLSLSKTLKSVDKTLDSLSRTVDRLEGQMQGITAETTELLHKTNALAEDVQHKTEQLNTVVYAVKDVGLTVQNLNQSINKVTTTVASQMEKNQYKISQAVQWGNIVKQLVEKFKEGKEERPRQANAGELSAPESASSVTRQPNY
ncbi:DUF948 domain-containing protein [Bacillus badius]|uniref:Pyridoxamine 5'-phosphate oxidase n=1 Tax=Bacillus badius TaxID=1455 RepID=A0ABR5ASS8_BACBA|nr:DUF948 domain-containing protein [Bacillus badius]KIL75682.1 Pyridoxamine 5'-phosphate oxidase [Bacillus badius]KIL77816.1 Pyridoxamine 5'-phosphate oxidase [Bacillus badius]KZR59211.1 hypothetical protein A3781_13685 [Bacillus badius]MED4715682.1 DUF948 domain-containing protein [Bacillus badius]